MSSKLTPMQVCERLIGPPEAIARACNFRSKQGPYRWRHAANDRDAGDIPSARSMRSLLDWSNARNLGLTADHLIYGAEEMEVEAILASRLGQSVAAE